eukprot:Seg230.24 transcript_id=Seg230.24/GoldUCD/mRNA.D3Y31 product="dTDP-D-glucose 4 6-dehydratase" protein_id=Seg230.24/GoldUCD/D3Y31
MEGKIFSLFLGLLSFYTLFSSSVSTEEKEKRILVLGGNGFLGGETVELLLNNDYEVTIVNRGNKYFDSDTRIEPEVKQRLICDRDTLIRKTCPKLKKSGKYDAVIDFSSYNSMQMESMIDMLRGRTSLYVYISTDAVYEVCEKTHHNYTREIDGVRPEETMLRDKLANNDKYGDQKLSCEEALQDQRKRGGFPYVILRLADAIGPRDTTARLWTYQAWVKLHRELKLPIHLPKGIHNKTFSFVYSKDVANAILTVLKSGKRVHDKTMNLAFREEMTLAKLLEKISSYLGVENLLLNENDESAWYRFPTVNLGPLNTTVAESLIDWNPTPLDMALNETLSFNEDAMVDKTFAKEREIMLAGFVEDILLEEMKDDDILERTLIDSYGPAVLDGLDLGLEIDPEQPQIRMEHGQSKETGEQENHDYVNRQKLADPLRWMSNWSIKATENP